MDEYETDVNRMVTKFQEETYCSLFRVRSGYYTNESHKTQVTDIIRNRAQESGLWPSMAEIGEANTQINSPILVRSA